jgi:hypothetical protein
MSIDTLDSVYTVWEGNPSRDILFKRNTISFDPSINLSDNTGDARRSTPAIAASGNNVYVVWHDNTPGNFDIFYKRSTDGGANFGSTVNISNNFEDSTNPAVAVSNNLT